MPVDVMDLVGHSIVGFTVDGFNVSLHLDNGIVIEPLEFSDAEFASPEDFARFLERVGCKVLAAHYGTNLTETCVDVFIGKSAKDPCFKVRTRPDLIRRC